MRMRSPLQIDLRAHLERATAEESAAARVLLPAIVTALARIHPSAGRLVATLVMLVAAQRTDDHGASGGGSLVQLEGIVWKGRTRGELRPALLDRHGLNVKLVQR
jgi:hypothetical protein